MLFFYAASFKRLKICLPCLECENMHAPDPLRMGSLVVMGVIKRLSQKFNIHSKDGFSPEATHMVELIT